MLFDPQPGGRSAARAMLCGAYASMMTTVLLSTLLLVLGEFA